MNSNTIKRDKYLDRIKPFIGQSLIKVFTGQRRVGKSYMLFQVMDLIRETEKEAKIIYINKEDLAFDHINTAKELNEYVVANRNNNGKTYLFIDEIQDISDFHKALRSLILDINTDIYCTGSNAQLMSSDIAGVLSGRFIEMNIYSLSYNEFLTFHNLTDSESTLAKYMKYGGLPYLRNLPLKDNIVFEYLKNIYTTILYRDVINRYNIRNTQFLEKLVLFLANNTGSLFSAKKISDYLKNQKVNISPIQVQNYTTQLTNAFLIHKSRRYDIYGKRTFDFGEKYYFENLGIRHGIWGYRPEDAGKIMENVVFNHLLYCGYQVKTGVIDNEEIDFVCEKDGERIYVQVALLLKEEKTKKREFGNLSKIADNFPKYVITMDDFDGNTIDGIKHMSLRKFLLKEFN